MLEKTVTPKRPPLLLVVPFYRNAELVEPFFSSLTACSQELLALRATVVAINDSPDDPQLSTFLRKATEDLNGVVPCRLIENPYNLGFVRSVNHGLREAVAAGADAVLLNSDTIVFRQSLTEIQRVAYADSMIGFVSPRSNNATLCSFPHQEEFRKLRPAESYAVFCELSIYLPEFHYVPTAVGFCMFIKLEILREFGFLDEVYGKGYNEENDLVMRANRCGYRAALANRAFVYHFGESSFAISETPKTAREDKNAALLASRYPEYPEQIRSYMESSHYRAEGLLRGLLKDARSRYDIVFDFSTVGSYHNGTFEAAKQILIHAAQSWKDIFNIHVLIEETAARFHGLHAIPGIYRVPTDTQAVFAIAFRFGQPFQYEVLARMSGLAAINVYSMLDPIAWDCLYLNRDDLDELWRAVFCHADAVMYISDFVAQQFRSRFRFRPGLKERVSYLSLDTQDYAPLNGHSTQGDYLLVIGNSFAHKHVRPTVEALAREFPRQKIVALGLTEVTNQNVIGYASGHLSEVELDRLFVNAKMIIFPSFYEGFGIPIIRGLSYRKPLLARSNSVNRELSEKLNAPADFILYDSTDELIRHIRNGVAAWSDSVPTLRGKYDWATSTAELGTFLRTLPDEISFSDVLLPRVQFVELLRKGGFIGERNRNGLESASLVLDTFDEGLLTETYETRIKERDQRIEDLKARTRELSNHGEELRKRLLKISDEHEAVHLLAQSKEGLINQMRHEVDCLETAVRDRDLKIRTLMSSLSWMVTAPIRSVGTVWFKIFGR